VELRATLHAAENQDLICENCLTRYGPNVDAGVKMRASRGCEVPSTEVVFKLDEDRLKFRRCVGNFVSHQIFKWVMVSDKFHQGVMPFDGALMAQPAKAVELFTAIEVWRQEVQSKKMKEHQAKMARRAMGGRKPGHN